jgi:hypothetical protein
MRSLGASVFALAVLTAQAPTPLPTPTPDEAALAAVEHVSRANAPLSRFTFDVVCHIALHSFPWIHLTLHGHGAYVRGGEYKVHFDDPPWYAHGLDTLPMDALDTSTWASTYYLSFLGREGNVSTILMHIIKPSRLIDARAQLDSVEGVRDLLFTYDYGHLKIHVDPQNIEGFYLPESEEAEIVTPQYRASVSATFTNYHLERDNSGAAP